MLNRIFVMIMLLMSAFSLNAQREPLSLALYPTREITMEYFNWALTYRLPAWKVPLKYIEGGDKAWIELKLHHLAGNAMLILRMRTDVGYVQKIREKEMSHHLYVPESLLWAADLWPDKYKDGFYLRTNYRIPVDVVPERNSLDDLHKIMTVFQAWDWTLKSIFKPGLHKVLGKDILNQFYDHVSTLEEELTPYRKLRKLGLRSWQHKRDKDIKGPDFYNIYYPIRFLPVVSADEESAV